MVTVEYVAAALTATTVGLGVWLAITSLRGVKVLPDPSHLMPRLVPKAVPPHKAGMWLITAAVVAVAVWLVTGWPVAAIAAGVGTVVGPAALGGTARRQAEADTAEAIATWADMIRDTMAGASGLEESLIQTASVAPHAIRPQLEAFAQRLRHQPLPAALGDLAVDLDHRSADLLVAALASAARLEARDLGPLLARLAEAIRGDVRMRSRIEVGRTRIRTSGRIAVGTTVATVAFLSVFAGHLLEPYDTAAGQGWLVVVSAVFLGSGWLLRRYSHLEVPARFTLRHQDPDQ